MNRYYVWRHQRNSNSFLLLDNNTFMQNSEASYSYSKLVPVHAMKTWGSLGKVQPILILGMNGQLSSVAALLPGKEPLVPLLGDSMGSTAGLLLVNTVTVLNGLNHSISCLYKIQLMECYILVIHVIFPSVLIIITNMFKVQAPEPVPFKLGVFLAFPSLSRLSFVLLYLQLVLQSQSWWSVHVHYQ